jgi:Chaperone of endosialidase
MARDLQCLGNLLDREIFLSGPRVDNTEESHDLGSVHRVPRDWSQFNGTAPLADCFLFSSQTGVDQTEHAERPSIIGLFAHDALDLDSCSGEGFLRCRVADAITVVIDSAGQLGTISSSRRLKKDVKSMDRTSEAILALQPVTFHYKTDTKGTPQFGLIAEEVAAVDPDLVVRDNKGEIYTVRYEAVNAMLLNEFLKEHRKVKDQEVTIAQLQSEMELLAAHLKEQDLKIEKVSAQLATASPSRGGLEVRNPAPQLVLTNH